MSLLIQNAAKLATTPARRDALEIVDAGLRAVHTETVIRRTVQISGGELSVGGHTFTLSDYENIYIIGFGKVTCEAAYVLESMLRTRVRDGAVIGVSERTCSVIDTYAGTHPRPSHYNYTATKHIAEIAQKAGKDDLVLVIVSGGGSALLCSSMDECAASTTLYNAFTSAGGTIEELNTVRKHISKLKGGGLAELLYPATVVGLIFSDVPGGDLALVASGPTFYDDTTTEDARAIIEQYGLGSFTLRETPKDRAYFERVYNVGLVTNKTALAAMCDAAVDRGYTAQIVSHDAYLTPTETAAALTDGAGAGCVSLMGGETLLSIPENCTGRGGRNDYLALTMLDYIEENQVFLSVASDGHDNGPAAGAIVDGETATRAQTLGLNATDHHTCMDSFPFFDSLDEHIYTGTLASNVSDLMLLLTPVQNSDTTTS